MTRIALNIATVFATLTGLAVVWEFRGAALIFCMSLALAAAVRPTIEFFVKRRCPVVLAVGATYLPLLGIVGFLIFLSVSRLGNEFNQMVQDSSLAYKQIERNWRHGNWLEQEIAHSLPDIEKDGTTESILLANSQPAQPQTSKQQHASGQNHEKGQQTNNTQHANKTQQTNSTAQVDSMQPANGGNWEMGFAETLFGLTLSAAGVVFDALLVIVMSIYWSIDRIHFERLWLSLLSAATRGPARQIWRAIETEIGRYLRSEFLQSLFAGLLLAGGYWLIGCPYPVLVALLGAAAWLIPWIGVLLAVLGLTVTSLPALITDASWHPFFVLGGAVLYTCMVLLLLEILVEPRLFDRQRYSTVLIAFVAISLAMVWGVFGLLVGPPLAVVLQVFGSYIFRRRLGLTGETAPTPAEVAVRLAELRASLNTSPTPHPELNNMVDRLSTLMEEVQQELEPSATYRGDKDRAHPSDRTAVEAFGR